MPDRISAARAHVLVLEELADYAAGEGLIGSCSEDPTQAYPANLVFVVEKPLPSVGKRAASKWTIDDTPEPTEDKVREDVRTAVDAVRQIVAEHKALTGG